MKHVKLFEGFFNNSKENPEEKFEERKKQLLHLGFRETQSGDFFLKDIWGTYWEQIHNHDDKWWDEYLKDIEAAIEKHESANKETFTEFNMKKILTTAGNRMAVDKISDFKKTNDGCTFNAEVRGVWMEGDDIPQIKYALADKLTGFSVSVDRKSDGSFEIKISK